ncbi:MAG: hypothetical protein WAK01_06920, partial [Methylocystis sp.]
MASKSKSRKPSTKPSALPDGYYTVPARLFDTLLELARGPLKSGTELASTAPEIDHPTRAVTEFVDTHLHSRPGYRVSAAAVYSAFEAWASSRAIPPCSQTAFGRVVGRRFRRLRGHRVDYLNCELRTDAPAPAKAKLVRS